MRRLPIVTTALLVLLATATQARAAEGAFEINQLCVASGCFAGDDPGFPVEITRSGRYVLTSDLDVSGEPDPAFATGVSIDVILGNASVTLDLNGFAIRGPVTCSGLPTVTACTPSVGTGGGSGVAVASVKTATIRNGTIFGMGQYGIHCQSGSTCTIRDLSVEQNADSGIRAEFANIAVVENVVALRNGADGFFLGIQQGSVEKAEARGNAGSGIRSGAASITGSSATANGGDGIAGNASIERSTASSNGQDGILCPSTCIARANVARFNTRYGINFLNGSMGGANRMILNDVSDANFETLFTEILPNSCTDGSC